MLHRGEEQATSTPEPDQALESPPASKAPGTSYAKLSPGPGKAANDVAAHQKARIHAAVIESVGERGYQAATVRDLARLASVSTRAFYANFSSKEECFAQTYELIVRRAITRIVASQAGERDWEERLHLALRAFVRELEREPQAARLALIDALAAGPAARNQVCWAERVFSTMLAESFARAPGGAALPPLLSPGLIAGIAWAARSRLLWNESIDSGLGDELADWVLSCARAGELIRPLATPPGRFDEIPSSKAGGETRAPAGDRDLILSATLRLAASEDAGSFTPARVRALAGVSRKAFEEQFDGIDDCLVVAAESLMDRLFAHALGAKSLAGSWEEGVRLAILDLCDQAARDRALANLVFVDVLALDRPGLHCCERFMAEIGNLICCDAPSGKRPDDVAIEASAGAMWGIMRELVVNDRRRQLPQVAPTLAALALAPSARAAAPSPTP